MKWLQVRPARTLAWNAALLGATTSLVLLVRVAHSQQEIDPTWHEFEATQQKRDTT